MTHPTRHPAPRNTLALLFALGAMLSPSWAANVASTATPAAGEASARAVAAYARLPLAFEANHGQTDAGIRFLARGNGFAVFLTPAEVVLALSSTPRDASVAASGPARSSAPDAGVAIRIRAVGMNPAATIEAFDPLPGMANYFVGRDPSRWQRGVATSARVAYRDVYPGIDLVFHGDRQSLEYDFVIARGADPGAIALTFEGAERLALEDGVLVLHTALGAIRQPPPVCFQEVDGSRRPVEGRYELRDGRVRFALGDYDHGRQLVIDPVLTYATHLGGTGIDFPTVVVPTGTPTG